MNASQPRGSVWFHDATTGCSVPSAARCAFLITSAQRPTSTKSRPSRIFSPFSRQKRHPQGIPAQNEESKGNPKEPEGIRRNGEESEGIRRNPPAASCQSPITNHHRTTGNWQLATDNWQLTTDTTYRTRPQTL